MSRILRFIASILVVTGVGSSPVVAAEPEEPAAAAWYRSGADVVAQHASEGIDRHRARNVILFVGDGMGISTVTAARILAGQRAGGKGEDHQLAFETLPFLALSKTYSTTQQTPDSAPTATAMVAGIKTRDGAISVDETVNRNERDANVIARHAVTTILEQAEAHGLSTGIVTTTRLKIQEMQAMLQPPPPQQPQQPGQQTAPPGFNEQMVPPQQPLPPVMAPGEALGG